MAAYRSFANTGPKRKYTVKKDNVVTLKNPAEHQHDLLTEVLRQGAQQLLVAAVNAELEQFLEAHSNAKTPDGKSRFVRNGFLPEREIQTGIGEIPIKMGSLPFSVKFNLLIPNQIIDNLRYPRATFETGGLG